METSKYIFLNRWFLAMLVIGVVALAASMLAVYVFHLKPCIMCKLQRIPFVLLIVNAGFGLLSSCKQGFFKVIQGCLVLGIVLGFWHFLMQVNALPDFCSAPKEIATVEEFSKMLKTPRCSKTAWSILGIPVSLLNGMFCALILGVGFRFRMRKRLMAVL